MLTYSNSCAIIFTAKALRDTISLQDESRQKTRKVIAVRLMSSSLLRLAVAVASFYSEGVIFLPSSDKEGGGIMEYVTWYDLIKIAMLVIAIIACFRNNNKKR